LYSVMKLLCFSLIVDLTLASLEFERFDKMKNLGALVV